MRRCVIDDRHTVYSCVCHTQYYVADVDSKTVLRLLQADGWEVVGIKGSHHQLKHESKPGRVTVPHPEKDLPIGTLKSIEKQSGVRLK